MESGTEAEVTQPQAKESLGSQKLVGSPGKCSTLAPPETIWLMVAATQSCLMTNTVVFSFQLVECLSQQMEETCMETEPFFSPTSKKIRKSWAQGSWAQLDQTIPSHQTTGPAWNEAILPATFFVSCYKGTL